MRITGRWSIPNGAEILVVTITGIIVIALQTACNQNDNASDSSQTTTQLRDTPLAVGSQAVRGSEDDLALRDGFKHVIFRKFGAVGLGLYPWATYTPPSPASLLVYSTCDSFYYDSERAKANCGYDDMLKEYGKRYRQGISPDTFSVALIQASPGASIPATGSRLYGAGGPGDNRYQRYGFVFMNSLNDQINANAQPDYRYIYKYNMLGLDACHEIGHEYGLQHAIYDNPAYGEDDSINIYHRVYGYNGRCIMMAKIGLPGAPLYFGAHPESANFCKDAYDDQNNSNTCWDILQTNAP